MHPSGSFEETHRHYSFIAVLAMMSLFLLITISITGLLLGFCRKKSGANSRSDGRRDGNSQFELDDMDMEVETLMRKGDPHGVCYFHLSDDDMEDDDDDADADDDDDDGDDNDDKNANEKRRKKADRRREKKWRKLMNKGYYYHLYTNDDDDSLGDNEQEDGVNSALSSHRLGSNGPENTKSLLPKRSITFPQLHNVFTSCIKGHNPHADYQKLQHSPVMHPHISSSNHQDAPITSKDISKHTYGPLTFPETSSSRQRHHTHTSVQIKNSNSYAGLSPGDNNLRIRHKQRQRQARNQRQPLHQYNKLRTNQMQHYASLSYHRHSRLHHAIKHNTRPTQKRIPVVRPEGSGFLYKSHSIHAIPCSNPEESLSAGTLNSQCQVQITVERVDYRDNGSASNDIVDRK